MSVFGLTTYASIDEVWNSSQFAPSIENVNKNTGYQQTVLAQNETKEPDDAACARHINAVFKKDGLAGVRKLIDPVIIREIQTQSVRKYASTKTTMLSPDELLYIALALLAVVFAMDS